MDDILLYHITEPEFERGVLMFNVKTLWTISLPVGSYLSCFLFYSSIL